jgi:hypothetical protein
MCISIVTYVTPDLVLQRPDERSVHPDGLPQPSIITILILWPDLCIYFNYFQLQKVGSPTRKG